MFNLKNTNAMRKKCLLMVVVGMMLASAKAPTAMAQEVAGMEITTSSTLPITGVYTSTDGKYNFKNFEVEASESGSYFTEFWLMPAKYADNSYTTFWIYVNGEYVGSIRPASGNWQSARVDGNETFDFEKGSNVITIATRAPELPEVETLKVAMNDRDAAFSSEAFESYLDEAVAGASYDVPEEEDGISMFASAEEGVNVAHFTNVPLRYTYYNTFQFTAGQDIFITCSSPIAHNIDVVFYGDNTFTLENNIPDYNNPPGYVNAPQSGTLLPGLWNPNFKPQHFGTRATSEEMQGLNWRAPSQQSLNSTAQVSTARIKIPKTGQYLVRIRSMANGTMGVADLNVNGAYFYEDVPISFSYVRCSIPADANEYGSMTCCNNFGSDDPFIFIHGAYADRIVGYNDDGPSAKLKEYNLSKLDSYISQRYNVETSGISVSNYSSSNPVSRCNILARVSQGAAKSVARSRANGSGTAEVSKLPVMDDSVIIPGVVSLDGMLTISANETIQNVTVYGLAGNLIGSAKAKESSADIPVYSLNISQPGIYIVSVETANGLTSKKIIAK